jgi:hypothetical protein
MYERFTDRARKVMQLAHQEAQRFKHEYLGTEHILLGLVEEGAGVAANVLKNLDIDLRKIRLEVEKIVQSGPDRVIMGRLPQTPRFKKVIEYSIMEARNLNHNYVGTEHLLLGLLREQEGVAAQVLMNFGLKLEDVREEVLNLLGNALKRNSASAEPADTGPPPEPAPPRPDCPANTAEAWDMVVTGQLWRQRSRLDDLEKRLHSLEGRLGSARFLLGALAGALAGVLLAAHTGAVLGLIAGGFLAVLGRFVPAALGGGLAGALLGTTYLADAGGGVTGALVGASLAACIVEVGRLPGGKSFFREGRFLGIWRNARKS